MKTSRNVFHSEKCEKNICAPKSELWCVFSVGQRCGAGRLAATRGARRRGPHRDAGDAPPRQQHGAVRGHRGDARNRPSLTLGYVEFSCTERDLKQP